MTKIIDGVVVELSEEMSDAEIMQYIERGRKMHGLIDSMEISIDGDYVDAVYHVLPVRFDRIRRITGYLVGTLDRFNNAKRAEVSDRVKHG